MLIMIDTNVLISLFLFPTAKMQAMINKIAEEHKLVLCSHIIDELHRVVNKKFFQRASQLEGFLYKLPYELVYTPENIVKQKDIAIRDKNDYPILISAIIGDVDILITGDKDFSDVDIEKPEILTPSEFMNIY